MSSTRDADAYESHTSMYTEESSDWEDFYVINLLL